MLQRVILFDCQTYSLISVHEVGEQGQKKVKLLKMRNAQSFKEWAGDWSDKSKKWTPELKKKVNF